MSHYAHVQGKNRPPQYAAFGLAKYLRWRVANGYQIVGRLARPPQHRWPNIEEEMRAVHTKDRYRVVSLVDGVADGYAIIDVIDRSVVWDSLYLDEALFLME